MANQTTKPNQTTMGNCTPGADRSFSITNSGTFTVHGDFTQNISPLGPSLTARTHRPAVHAATDLTYLVHLSLRQYHTPEIQGPDFWNLDEHAADRIWSHLAEHEFKRKRQIFYDRVSTFHLFMQYYQQHTQKAKSLDHIFNVVNALCNQIKAGSFNPYGNGQTSEAAKTHKPSEETAYERRQARRLLEKSTLPPQFQQILNEEMEKFEAKPTQNNINDIKHSRSLNYFRRDFEKAVLDEGTPMTFEYSLQKIVWILQKQGYDVVPTPESNQVIKNALRIFLNSGILPQYGHLRSRLDLGFQFVVQNKKKGKKIRKVILKYLYLLSIPDAVYLACSIPAQGFFDSIMSGVVSSVSKAIQANVVDNVVSAWDLIKNFILEKYRELLQLWMTYSDQLIAGAIIAGSIILMLLVSTVWQCHADAFFQFVTGFQRASVPHAQGGEIHTEFIAASLAAWKGVKDFSTVLGALNTMVLSTKNVVEFIKSAVSLIKEGVDLIYEEFWGEPYTTQGLSRKELHSSHKELVTLMSTCSTADFANVHTAKVFVDNYKKIIKNVATLKPNDAASKEFLTSVSRQMRDWRVQFQQCQHIINQSENSQPRKEPLGILFHGESGKGKTYFSTLLFEYLSLRYRNEKFTGNDLYSRNSKDDFYSGYHNQWVMLFDEFLQSKDPNDRILQALEIIDAINTKSWQLVMPGLEEKGSTYFRSEIVIATTNQKLPLKVAIEEPNALHRRFIAVKITQNNKSFESSEDGTVQLNLKTLNENYRFEVDYFINGDLEHHVISKNVDFSGLICILDERKAYNDAKFGEVRVFDPAIIDHTHKPSGASVLKVKASLNEDGDPETPEKPEDELTVHKPKANAQGIFDYLPDFSQTLISWHGRYKVPYKYLLKGYTSGITKKFREWLWQNNGSPITDQGGSQYQAYLVQTLRHKNGPEMLYFVPPMYQDLLFQGRFDAVVEVLITEYSLKFMGQGESAPLLDLWGSGNVPPEPQKYGFNCLSVSKMEEEQYYTLNAAVQPYLLKFCYQKRVFQKIHKDGKIKYYFDYWTVPKDKVELEELKSACKEIFPNFVSPATCARLDVSFFAKRNYYLGITALSLASIGLVAIAISAAIALLCYTFGLDFQATIFGQSSNPHMKKWEKIWNKKRSIGYKGRQVIKATNLPKAQSYSGNFLNLAMKVANNTKLFRVVFESGVSILTPATMIHDRVFVFPGHAIFSDKFSLEMYLSVQQREEFFVFNSDQLNVHFEEDRDFVLVRLPETMPGMRSLLKTLKESPPELYGNVARVSFDDDGDKMVIYCSATTELLEQATYTLLDKTLHVNPLVLVAHGCHGIDGDCGFWYLEDTGDTPLVGIHVAGMSSLSYVTPIYRTDIMKFLELLVPPVATRLTPPAQCLPWMPPELKFEETTQTGLLPYPVVGKLAKPLYQPTKTSLERSPLFNGVVLKGKQIGKIDYPDLMGPAKLSPKGDKDPVKLAFRKAKGRVRKPQPEGMDDPELWVGIFPKFKWRVLTEDEVMNGIPGLVASFETNKSTGHPGLELAIPKQQWIRKATDEGGQYIHNHISKEEALFQEGVDSQRLYMPTYVVFLKDELRPWEKVFEFLSRAIFAAPKWFVRMFKKYFGLWMAHTNLDTTSPIKVGINPFSTDWWHDYLKIIEYGADHIAAQDVSAWDLNFWYWFGALFASMYIAHYGITDTRERRVITYLSIAHFLCYIIVRELIYFFDGMTSGGPGTAHLNSAGNVVKNRWICKRIMWDTLKVRIPLSSYVYILTFGDDLHETIKRIVADMNKDGTLVFTTDVITPKLIAEYALTHFGHVHTTADKKDISLWDTMDTAEFLKRKHVKRDGVVMAPMNLDSIRSHLLWINRDSEIGPKKQFTENVHNALREFFLHGREIFNMEKARLNPYLESISEENQFFQTYDELMVKYQKDLGLITLH